jgi:hypothetical protein
MIKQGWRPKNWHNPHRYWDGEPISKSDFPDSIFDTYEQGADAMLKAILEENCNASS